jgi:hypothetical protein
VSKGNNHLKLEDMETKMYSWVIKVIDNSEPNLEINFIDLYGLTEDEAIAKVRELKNEHTVCGLYRLNRVI